MWGIPPGSRHVVKYKIFEITFEDKEPELHCFGYEGGGMNDWVWSTRISVPSILVSFPANAVKVTSFCTKSGSEYVAECYDEKPLSENMHTRLLNWFSGSVSMRMLSETEWENLID